MSTNPVVPKPNVGTVLNSLSQVGGYIGVAIQLGQVSMLAAWLTCRLSTRSW